VGERQCDAEVIVYLELPRPVPIKIAAQFIRDCPHYVRDSLRPAVRRAAGRRSRWQTAPYLAAARKSLSYRGVPSRGGGGLAGQKDPQRTALRRWRSCLLGG
jgi:hypothetical protein